METQFLTDKKGKKTAVLISIKEYEKLMRDLEELEDIRLYDEAKKNDDGVRISIDEAFKIIEEKRKLDKQ
jgi:PHD/YefM family antitoxin component YafN of YafNO toxin-antitoxin module